MLRKFQSAAHQLSMHKQLETDRQTRRNICASNISDRGILRNSVGLPTPLTYTEILAFGPWEWNPLFQNPEDEPE